MNNKKWKLPFKAGDIVEEQSASTGTTFRYLVERITDVLPKDLMQSEKGIASFRMHVLVIDIIKSPASSPTYTSIGSKCAMKVFPHFNNLKKVA